MKLSYAIKLLADAGVPDAVFDARELFETVGGVPRSSLYGGDPESDSKELECAVLRRANREPLQYIIGRVSFFREEYLVSPECLIPRQDTETLVEAAIARLPRGARFADLCTGSGCVGISVLANSVDTSAVLVDISEGALAVAEKNAERNGVLQRAELLCRDVLREPIEDKLFAVLSNPPYVSPEAYEGLEREIYFEPKIAFVGDRGGAQFYERLIPLYRDLIDPRGFIAFEIGFDQAELLRCLAEENGMYCEIVRDLGGNDRVAVLTHKYDS